MNNVVLDAIPTCVYNARIKFPGLQRGRRGLVGASAHRRSTCG